MFSDKSKIADAKWKIVTFKQEKKHIVDFMIEFKVLAIKADTDKLHAIFLPKKNVCTDIIKMILGYLLIATPKTLKEWKIAITSVEQGYESIEEQQDYRTRSGTTYRRQGILMDIRKSKEKFKDGKPRCFNCDIYRHMIKDCRKPKKEKNTRNCYKCEQVEHIAKDYRTG